MDLFVIDTVGDTGKGPSLASIPRLSKSYVSTFDGITASATVTKSQRSIAVESDDDEDYEGLPPPGQSIAKILNQDDSVELQRFSWKRKQVANVSDTPLPSADIAMPGSSKRSKLTNLADDDLCRTNVEKELKGAVLTPAIEKKEDIARLAMSDKTLRKLNKLERQKTKGKNWFGLSAPEITPELQNDLALLKMRSVLDPKQSFKRLEKRKTPKYFEIGKIIDSPLDHFNERGVKKLKSKSLVDELLADAEFQKRNKRKYAEALERQKKKAYKKAVMKMKKEKRKKK
uniref:Fcf2 domain-containing protein n=1 Tax=Anopheles epiroticus TaxID=199890 RepID=A0A182P5W6_9DIPT